MKLVKFNNTLYSSDVLTFEKAKAIKPSITRDEYEALTGNKLPGKKSKDTEKSNR